MPSWKLNIFVNAVKIRFDNGEGTYKEIIDTYTKLTKDERQEILEFINV